MDGYFVIFAVVFIFIYISWRLSKRPGSDIYYQTHGVGGISSPKPIDPDRSREL